MQKTDIRNKIGLRIKELRKQHGLTQDRFALMTGINRSYLADIEKGNRNFGFDTLEKMVSESRIRSSSGGYKSHGMNTPFRHQENSQFCPSPPCDPAVQRLRQVKDHDSFCHHATWRHLHLLFQRLVHHARNLLHEGVRLCLIQARQHHDDIGALAVDDAPVMAY